MAPTLEDQDRLIVNKLAYRLARSADRRHRDALLPGRSRQVVRQARRRRAGRCHPQRRGPRVSQRRAAARRLHSRGIQVARHVGPAKSCRRATTSSWATTGTTAPTAALGLRAEEIHHRQGADPLVAVCRAREIFKAFSHFTSFRLSPSHFDPVSKEAIDDVRVTLSTTARRTLSVGVNSPDSIENGRGSNANFLICSNCASGALTASTTA